MTIIPAGHDSVAGRADALAADVAREAIGAAPALEGPSGPADVGGAGAFAPSRYTAAASATTPPTPRPQTSLALLAGAPLAALPPRVVAVDAGGSQAPTGGDPGRVAAVGPVSVTPRIGAMATARRSAFQNSPAVCQRSVGLTATALARTSSTSSLTDAPSVRGVGRRSGLLDETASWMKSSPSSASRPMRASTTMSASANTSVHGPVDPCVRENCSGAPYAGVKLVTCPLVLAKAPAIFCASEATFAMPKSRSLTVASPRGSPMTKMFAGLTSRCATPFRWASASASDAGSSSCTVSAGVRRGRERPFSAAKTASSVAPSSHSRTMNGMRTPLSVSSIPMSRACTMAAVRAERSARMAPS